MNKLDNIGVIVKIEQDEAVVMTDDAIFTRVKRNESMFPGQKILIRKEDLLDNGIRATKYFYPVIVGFAALFILAFVLLFSYYMPFNTNLTYAYIHVDINPSIELEVGTEEVVNDVKCLNEDAKKLMTHMNLKGLNIKNALKKIVDTSRKNGYINPGKEESVVLISASLSEKHKVNGKDDNQEKRLDDLLESMKKELEKDYGRGIKAFVVRVPQDYREKSEINKVSMGKYLIYTRAKDLDREISLEEMNGADVYTLIKRIEPAGTEAVLHTSTPLLSTPLPEASPLQTSKPQITAAARITPVLGLGTSTQMIYTPTPITTIHTATTRPQVVYTTPAPVHTPADTVTMPPVPNSIQEVVVSGLRGEYYDNLDFTDLKRIRIDPEVNFRWGEGCPDSLVGSDTFSVRWTGKIIPRYSEQYTFITVADDGVRLWVNNILLIDNWKSQRPAETKGTIDLVEGTRYDIKLEYFDNIKSGQVKLYWSSTSQQKEIVPPCQLYHVSGVYQAEQAGFSKGVVESVNTGFSGSGYINYHNETGGYIEWIVKVEHSATYNLNFRYANGTKTDRPLEIKVDNSVITSSLNFSPTNAWTTWCDKGITVQLHSGIHIIRATALTKDGGPNIDYLELLAS